MTATAAPRRTRRTRRILVPLATLVAASAVAVASGATFSTSTASTGLVASGTLRQINSNSVAFAQSNLKPGDVVTGSVQITNSGTLPAKMTLTETAGAITFAPASDVQVEIKDGATVVDSGTIGTLGATDLGTWAAGASRTFAYTVTFNAAATNAQQAKSAAATYTFGSVQTDAETFASTPGTVQDVPNP